MTTPIHRGKVTQGKLILENQSRFLVDLSRLEGKEIELTIRQKKSKRSLNQNSAYWGIMIEILSECEAFGGYTKDEIHDALRKEFLSKIDPITGLTKIRSTTSLNTKEFAEYYDTIQRWAAQFLNCYIPSPNEFDYSEVMP